MGDENILCLFIHSGIFLSFILLIQNDIEVNKLKSQECLHLPV